mgnify:CR=1 FL=1
MKKLTIILSVLLFAAFSASAQQQITGKITNAESGEPIPGVSIVVKGQSTIGTTSDMDGNYTLEVPSDAQTLVYSFVGMQTKEVAIEGRTTIDVQLQPTVKEMEEVVVTALGVSREKKSLGYSVSEVGGDNLAQSKQSNPLNSLSGKVAGVNIKQSNTMGGSVNMIVRGYSSMTGNNQPLFVVDGVPIDNSNVNTSSQKTGGAGYDYGNAAADINPEDIKDISILKGAAATALYGSRAARGVVLITTKSGEGAKEGEIGVTVNSSYTVSTVNDKTYPNHQYQYGAAYSGSSFFDFDIDGDGETEKIVKTMDDASLGSAFDPSLQVIHWDALYPSDPNYLETRPWKAPEHGIDYFFRPSPRAENNISFSGGNEEGSFRMSYTNVAQQGIIPKSNITKHNVSFNGSYNFSDNLNVKANANYVSNRTIGRYGTGYDGRNIMQSFGQWFQTNVDFKRLENYQSNAGLQKTWNLAGPTSGDLGPMYFNNPYWVRNEMWEDDGRDRIYGKVELNYDMTDWFSITGRVGMDHYNWYRNERVAVGSLETSDFTKRTNTYTEVNTKLLLRFDKTFGDLSVSGLVGGNMLRRNNESLNASTVGGLIVPGLYTVSNSKSPVSATETLIERGKNSVFANVSIGYNDFLYLEVTGRNDWSSTLPDDNNSYFYPSVSTSMVFSELINADFLSFGKLRLNYAEVGSDAPAYSLQSTFSQPANFGDHPLFSVNSQFQNPELKPENTKSYEAGLEMNFFERRVGFDLAFYQSSTFNQIMPVDVTDASGVDEKYVNGGELRNRGVELNLYGTPIKTNDFSWRLNVNWAQNNNEVVKLAQGIENYYLFGAWGLSVNATEGEPYGAIRGKDFVYQNGKRVVYPDDAGFAAGRFQETAEDQVIGNVQPDWKAGIGTTLSYKNLTFNILFDIQEGGDIYSVNNKYGMATGVYAQTAGTNDRGGKIRAPVSEGGGYRFPNTVYPDGTKNETYIPSANYGSAWYYGYIPEAYNTYDASYVKLREASLSYRLPQELVDRTPFTRLEVSIIGNNLAILSKNTPHFDPEAILSSGRFQGIEQGAYPSTRTWGVNLTIGL